MTSFEKFLNKIISLLPGDILGEKQAMALASLDPEKIYVENVRSVLDVSTRRAEQICETAVRQGLFQKLVEVLCPDGVVAASAASEAELPQKVMCWIDTGRGFEEIEFPTSRLNKTVFYRLVDNAAARNPERETA